MAGKADSPSANPHHHPAYAAWRKRAAPVGRRARPAPQRQDSKRCPPKGGVSFGWRADSPIPRSAFGAAPPPNPPAAASPFCHPKGGSQHHRSARQAAFFLPNAATPQTKRESSIMINISPLGLRYLIIIVIPVVWGCGIGQCQGACFSGLSKACTLRGCAPWQGCARRVLWEFSILPSYSKVLRCLGRLSAIAASRAYVSLRRG